MNVLEWYSTAFCSSYMKEDRKVLQKEYGFRRCRLQMMIQEEL